MSKPARKTDPKHGDATTEIRTRKDEKDGFTRTALVIVPGAPSGSVDLVTKDGARIAQVNVFLTDDGTLMVDVIDVDDNFKTRRALTFPKGMRKSIDAGPIVAAHFEGSTFGPFSPTYLENRKG